jgi:hypothetical protein
MLPAPMSEGYLQLKDYVVKEMQRRKCLIEERKAK